MADWPKAHLERATLVHIESDGHAWEMDGATFVGCLEAGRWVYFPGVSRETHRLISAHRCLCGWEGDDAITHVLDVVYSERTVS